MKWLEVAKNLPVGQTARHDCPDCGEGTDTNAAIINHNIKYYSIYCHACGPVGYEQKGVLNLAERQRLKELDDDALRITKSREIKVPADTTYNPTDFSREARAWLFQGGLTPTIWKKYRIGYSPRLERVVLPIYDDKGTLTWYQLRAVHKGQRPKYIQPSADKSNIRFTAGIQKDCKRTVIVEDIMSAIRVGEAGARLTSEHVFNATSFLGTKVSTAQATAMHKYDRCTIWLDADRAGREGAKAIKRTIGMLCTVDQVRSEEDPKHYSNKFIQELVQ
jgi:DNA primase